MRVTALALILSSLAASLATAHSASAQSAGTTPDVRCLLTMGALASNKTYQRVAIPGVYFFAGRIRAKDPGFDFAKQLKLVASKMTPADLQGEAKRCGPMVVDVIKGMQEAQKSFGPPKTAPATAPTAAAPLKK